MLKTYSTIKICHISQSMYLYSNYFTYIHDDLLSLFTHTHKTFHNSKGVFPLKKKEVFIAIEYSWNDFQKINKLKIYSLKLLFDILEKIFLINEQLRDRM